MDSNQPNADWATPEAAEEAFYRALERGDLKAMMAVWEVSESIVCVHPMGPRHQGRAQVSESWRALFGADTRLSFVIDSVQNVVSANLAIRQVVENITVHDGAEHSTAAVLATNVFRRGRHGWRLLVHHASPAPAASPPPRQSLH